MKTRMFLALTALSTGLTLLACSIGGDNVNGSDSDINGSLSGEKACAVRAAYARAELSDLKTPAFSELPGPVQVRFGSDGNAPLTIASLIVPFVGVVYLVEDFSHRMTFADSAGREIATAVPFANSLAWSSPTGEALTCQVPVRPSDASAPNPFDASRPNFADASFWPRFPDASAPRPGDAMAPPQGFDAGFGRSDAN